MKSNQRGQAVGIGVAVVAFLILFVCLLTFGFVNIAPTQVGVEVDKAGGKVVQMPLGIGYHFYNHWLTDIVPYTVSARSFPADSMKTETRNDAWSMQLKTNDGQNVQVDMTVVYSLNGKEVPALHQEVGPQYEDQVLLPAMRSESRIAVGQFSAEQLYDGKIRESIQNDITQKLAASVAKYAAINIQNTYIRDFQFSAEFEKAIEAKKLAAQNVEVNKNQALAQEQEALRVEAEARGNKLKAIQEAEGRGESLKAEAEGNAASVKINADAKRYELEQEAAGNLAKYKAEAAGKKLAAEALGGGQYVVALKFAEMLSPDLKIVAYPNGAPGTTSLMDITGVFGNLLKNTDQSK